MMMHSKWVFATVSLLACQILVASGVGDRTVYPQNEDDASSVRPGFYLPRPIDRAQLIADSPSNLVVVNNSGGTVNLTGIYVFGAFSDPGCLNFAGGFTPGDVAICILWTPVTLNNTESTTVGQNYLYNLIWQVGATAGTEIYYPWEGKRPGNLIQDIYFLINVTNDAGAISYGQGLSLMFTTPACINFNPSGVPACSDTSKTCNVTGTITINPDPPPP